MSRIYTYDYDSNYDPAMPVVDIEIGRALAKTTLALTALVDSGADATMVPMNYLRQIQSRRSRKKWMRGAAGGRILEAFQWFSGRVTFQILCQQLVWRSHFPPSW